jgi:uncharacterized protein
VHGPVYGPVVHDGPPADDRHGPPEPAEPAPPVPRALLLGVAAGLLSGLFGVGGGIVLVPGLLVVAHLDQHRAHATSLAAIIITAPAALAPFAAEGAVSWPAAAALAAGGILGAVAGADVMRRVPADRLRLLFGVAMVVVAVRLLLPGSAAGASAAAGLSALAVTALAATGLGTGLLSALLGVGGGVVMVPVMVLAFGFDQHLAEGTSLAVIVPTAVVGAWRHARSGYTRWRLGLVVGAGGVAGGLAGGVLAQRVPADGLQAAFAALLAVVGLRLAWRAL